MDITQNKPKELLNMKGDWAVQSERIKVKFPQLNADDLKYQTGKEYELLSRLGKSLNKNRDEIISIIKREQQ
jgi:predicted transcriptional regulator